eukprot:gene7404-6948_t
MACAYWLPVLHNNGPARDSGCGALAAATENQQQTLQTFNGDAVQKREELQAVLAGVDSAVESTDRSMEVELDKLDKVVQHVLMKKATLVAQYHNERDEQLAALRKARGELVDMADGLNQVVGFITASEGGAAATAFCLSKANKLPSSQVELLVPKVSCLAVNLEKLDECFVVQAAPVK